MTIDLTERKTKANSFRFGGKREMKFFEELGPGVRSNLLAQLPGMFYRCKNDKDWTMTYVSEACLAITGYSNDEIVGNKIRSYGSLIHPDDEKWLWEKCSYNLERKEACNNSYRIITRSGIVKWVNEIANGIYDDDGNLIFIEGYIDETFNSSDSTLLSNILKSYQNAINASSILSITDVRGNILFVNDLFCSVSMFSRAELLGQNHRLVNSGYHPPEFFLNLWKNLLSGQTWRGEIKNKAKDGSYYWVDTVITPVLNSEKEIIQFLSVRNLITEKKENELLIHENEKRFSLAQRIAKIGHWEYSVSTKTMIWSAEMFRIFEVDPETTEDLFELYFSKIVPTDLAVVMEHFDMALETGISCTIEHSIVTGSGAEKHLFCTGISEFSDGGECLRVWGTTQDITERKNSEREIIRNRTRYRNLLENMNDGFIVDDLAGKVVLANEKFLEIFGLVDADLVQLNLEDYVSESFRSELRNRHNRRIKGEKVPELFEYEGVRKDGKCIWIEANVRLIIEDGIVQGTQSVVRDITAKKEQEREFVSMAMVNHKIIDAADEMFYFIQINDVNDQKNPITYLSEKTEEIIGINPEDLKSDPSIWFKSIHPDDVRHVNESKQILYGQKKSVICTYRLLHAKIGNYIWIQDFVKPILDSKGNIIELYGSARNISDLKIEQIRSAEFQSRLLSAQMNPHFIFNSLNSVQYFILQNNTEDAINYVANFSQLIRKTLENSRKPLITLADELTFLTDYLELEKLRQPGKFSFSIKVEAALNTEEVAMPPMFIQPYVENCIIHGLSGKLKDGEIWITFVQNGENGIICNVKDNGRGRAALFDQTEMQRESKHRSHGMDITQARLDLLNATYKNGFEVMVTDLYTNDGRASGTTVSLKIPCLKYFKP